MTCEPTPITLPDIAGSAPTKPPLGLLISMATRLDHAFGIKRSFILGDLETDEQFARRQEMLLFDALRLWEEANGQGFWTPSNNAAYERGMSDEVKKWAKSHKIVLDTATQVG